jgi:cell division protein FtsB
LLLPLLAVTVGALLFGFLVADRRARLYELRRRRAQTLRELQQLREKHIELADERDRLLTEPAAIERVAREQYGMVAPGEVSAPLNVPREKQDSVPQVPVQSDRWEWLLGRGQYPWRVPLLAFAVGAVVLGTVEVIEQLRGGPSDG